ncbi:MAG: PEP-CTERM sorting domain-containing protein [Rubrivivax sp.]|nr:PEP-CTERM sorting domain-containing protein [Rubrivivax sp.]
MNTTAQFDTQLARTAQRCRAHPGFFRSLAWGAIPTSSFAAQGAGFEAGIPAGWICTGNCGTLGASGVVTLAPGGHARYGYVVSEQAVVGVSAWSDRFEEDGSVLRTPAFQAAAGDPLRFNFNLVFSDGASGEYAATDYAWARLLHAADGTEAHVLVTLTMEQLTPGLWGWSLLPPGVASLSPAPVLTIPGAPNWLPLGLSPDACWGTGCGQTDWVNAEFTMPTAGAYVLEFGAIDGRDTYFPVGLAFDDITIAGNPISAVPEPASWALLLAGLATVSWRRRVLNVPH